LILTSLHSDHFNVSGKTPYIQTTDFLQLKYFPRSGPVLCLRTTSLYSIQRPSLHAERCNSSGTILTSGPLFHASGPFPYIRITSLHADQITSPHPDHFPTSGSLHYMRTRSLTHIRTRSLPHIRTRSLPHIRTVSQHPTNLFPHLLYNKQHFWPKLEVVKFNSQQRQLLTQLMFLGTFSKVYYVDNVRI